MDVSKGVAVPHVAAQSIRRLRIHEILGALLCLALLASTFEKVYHSRTLLVSFCTQALNMRSRGALPYSTSVISDNLSLGLTTDAPSERLYDLAGHHSLPSLITANKAERLAGQTGSSTSTSACSLHVMCLGRLQPAGIITPLELRRECSITRVASHGMSRSQEGLQAHQLSAELGFSLGRPISATWLARLVWYLRHHSRS